VNQRNRILILLGVLIGIVIFVWLIWLPSQPLQVEVVHDAGITQATTLGQINIEYPIRMSLGSSDGPVIVSIHIPDALVSLNPGDIEIVPIPPDAPSHIGARGSDEALIMISDEMRVELSAPAFVIESTTPATQPVNLDEIDDPTVWHWTLVAPDTPGLHDFTLSVYHGDSKQPVWVRIYQVEVVDSTSIWNRPLGTALIIAMAIILVGLIGLIAALIAKNRLPMVGTKAGYRRRLKTLHGNLNYLKEQKALYGPAEVPVSLVNEIRLVEEEITDLEEKLNKR